MILIISSSNDQHALAVRDHLKANNVDTLLLDLAETSKPYDLTIGFDGVTNRQTYNLFDGVTKIDLAAVRAVWWRDPRPFCPSQVHSSWAGLLLALDVFWVNRLAREAESWQMAYQLRTAREVGLKIPDSCITSDSVSARGFITKHGRENVLVRTLSNDERGWQAAELSEQLMKELLDNIKTAPVIFQERITFETDLYITFVEEKMIAAKATPDKVPEDKRDDIEKLLAKFMRRMGLIYGAAHVRVTEAGDIVFVDFNPLGAWQFYDDKVRSKVTDSLAILLRKRDTKEGRGPLGEIALSLSGGGYRAAAFHLGTLTMLHELKLLKDLTRLSTASGGTITALKYMHDMVEGKPFETFAREMHDFLSNKNIITLSIAGLRKTRKVNKMRSMPSLIRSAAAVYSDDRLVGQRTLGWLRMAGREIREVAFNSTEFRTGTNFRFQIADSPFVKSGTKGAVIDTQESDKIRLADIIAASACFPGGFEPMRFPSDFVWPDSLKTVRKGLGPDFKKDILLMDGGIFDNQGIDSIQLFLDRKDSSTDLFIISDTSPRKGVIYDRKPGKNWFPVPLSWVLAFAVLLFSSALLSVWTIGYRVYTLGLPHNLWPETAFYMASFLVALSVAALLVLALYKAVRFWPTANEKVGSRGWKHVLRLTVCEMAELLASRLTSVLKLTTSIFMARIRSSGFKGIFSDEKLNPLLLPNIIYDLDDEAQWRHKVPPAHFPTKGIRKKVKKVEDYPTNLDFDGKPDMLKTLVECGRATMCFNILRYLYRYKFVDIKITGTPLQIFFDKVKAEWEKCNK